MADRHSRAVTEAADAALCPLGVMRKSRSRNWFDDQSWWLASAEFKPSNAKPGTYLNVGLMFLWHPADHFIFEIGGQVEGFSPADDPGFEQAVQAKAARAAHEIQTMRASFGTAADVVRYYAPLSGRTSIYGQANLATALGLAGNMEHCQRALDRALRQRDEAKAELKGTFAWLLSAREAAQTHACFRSWTTATVQQTRQSLNLPGEFTLLPRPT
jgi:hypothetical protein